MRTIFSPVLNIFESSDTEYAYRASHRKILIAVGLLFLILSFGSVFAMISSANYGGVLPALVFFIIGLGCEVVGLLGTDKAVANIWKCQ